MARKTDDRLKRALLLCFVAVSVALIVTIYVTDLTGSIESAPAFYRGAPTMEPSATTDGASPTTAPSEPIPEAVTPAVQDSNPPNRTLDDE